MLLGRFLGWILVLAGLSVLVRDILVALDAGHFLPLAFGEAARQLDPTGRVRLPESWPAVTEPLSRVWAAPALALPGLALLVLCRRRNRSGRRGRRLSAR